MIVAGEHGKSPSKVWVQQILASDLQVLGLKRHSLERSEAVGALICSSKRYHRCGSGESDVSCKLMLGSSVALSPDGKCLEDIP